MTVKQEAFVLAYIQCGNATQAYREAGYQAANDKTAWEKASRLLNTDKVRARLEELRAPIAAAAGLTLERHLNDLLLMREEARRDGRWSAAISAEVARGKAAGLYTERAEISGSVSVPTVIELTEPDYEEICRRVSAEI